MRYGKRFELLKKQLIAEIGKCEKCGRVFNLTIDPIVPIHILEAMGFIKEETFDKRNFAVLCRKCNFLKAGRFDFTDKRTKLLLIEYLNKID